MSGGRYFRAEDAEELTDVLVDLPREFGLRKQDVEISVWFALVGASLAFTGAGLALWWNRVLPTDRARPRRGLAPSSLSKTGGKDRP